MDAVCSWCKAAGFPYIRDRAYNADKFVIPFDVGLSAYLLWYIYPESEQFKDKNLNRSNQ
jgi:hypothetical protein